MSDLPRLPDYVAPPTPAVRTLSGGTGRATASTLTKTSQTRVVQAAAVGAMLPVVYGRAQVPGLLFAQGLIGTDLVLGFLWCVGEIDAVEAVYINDEPIPTGVTLTNYVGASTQTVDTTLQSAISGYADTVRFETASGYRGAAYSVLRIPTGTIDAFPRVRATIRGRVFALDPYTLTPVSYTTVTGGTITTDTDGANSYKIHTFTADGTLVISGTDAGMVEYLIVGGGGEGGTGSSSASAGGGGGGGVVHGVLSLGPGSYSVTVGAGGSGVSSSATAGGAGADSVALGITAIGGGGGAGSNATAAGAGGSGGGAGSVYPSGQAAGEPQQGYEGGAGFTGTSTTHAAGGGGGAGGAGGAATSATKGARGDGFAYDISGAAVTYGQGGEGASYSATTTQGGRGGGQTSAWADPAGQPGLAGTGGGGGGSGNRGGGDGGSGAVIFRYVTAGELEVTRGDYTDTPAFFLADMIEDADYGMGVPVLGLAAAVAWNETALGDSDSQRARAGIVIDHGSRIYPDVLDMLAEYAECFYAFEGESVRLIPDAPVDLATDAVTVDASQIIRDSITLSIASAIDTPTEVEIVYTEPTTGDDIASPWMQKSYSRQLGGVATGDIDRIPTSVRLPGVYRYEDAANRAKGRLARQQNRLEVEWTTTDAGVLHQAGDVVRLTVSARGIDEYFRVTAVAAVAAGRYRVRGSRYDAAHYPDELELPSGIGTVPVGAITLQSGASVPDGWQAYSAADGKFILGADYSAYSPADTGGSTVITSISDSVSHAGHTGSGEFYAPAPPSGTGGQVSYSSSAFGSHTHTYSTGDITPNLYRRQNRLVQKITSAGTSLPAGVRVLGVGGISEYVAQQVTSLAGRLIAAASADANAGTTAQTISFSLDSVSYSHTHGLAQGTASTDFGPCPDIYAHVSAGGTHDHSVNALLTPAIKRRRLALYGSDVYYSVVPGMIMMWAGAEIDIPTDWVICDGTLDTPDMRGYFVEIAASDNADSAAGDNTITVSGTSSGHSHSHKGSTKLGCQDYQVSKHSASHTHTHTITHTPAFTPVYYALAFIMYQPAT